jgi:hypothetical protein
MGASFFADMTFASVIVHDFDVVGIALVPTETDPPLGIDPDAELPDSGSSELLQPIARRNA